MSVQLSKANLCIDCNHISESSTHRCPDCGSQAVVNLKRLLEHRIAEALSVAELERMAR